MLDNCPVCQTKLKNAAKHIPVSVYECPRCGKFGLDIKAKDLLSNLLYDEEEKTKEEKVAILSHAIRKMQRQDSLPEINLDLITAILKNPLPSPSEQANNLIIWFVENVPLGKIVHVQPSTHQSIVGAKTPYGFILILRHLIDQGLIDGEIYETSASSGQADATLTFKGWQYFEQLKRGAADSRKAFMAMEYGDEELDRIVDTHFKPAVADTGFELHRLDQKPKAGLIDDRLRVEIRTSRFLISDLTHENRGAYWEAGYAEGLGKPVIYTCKKEIFERGKTHFDTNHHLTIIWDEKEIQEAVESLKATIRATLPDEAKLSDG